MSHERDVHKEKPNGVYLIMGTVPTIPLHLGSETCPICNESYKTNKNLRNHLKDKHGYYIYHCQWCSEHNYFPKDIAEHVLESHHLPFMNPIFDVVWVVLYGWITSSTHDCEIPRGPLSKIFWRKYRKLFCCKYICQWYILNEVPLERILNDVILSILKEVWNPLWR